MGIASAAVFIATLYFAFTYSTWDWWVVLILVLSFIGVGSKELLKFQNKTETHNHFEKREN